MKKSLRATLPRKIYKSPQGRAENSARPCGYDLKSSAAQTLRAAKRYYRFSSKNCLTSPSGMKPIDLAAMSPFLNTATKGMLIMP